MSEIMDMHILIAAEFHITLPDTTPVYHIMQMANTASKRRADRMKATSEGKTYIG